MIWTTRLRASKRSRPCRILPDAAAGCRRLGAGEEVLVVEDGDPGFRGQDVDLCQIVAFADLEVVEIVSGRDLHGAAPLLRIGVGVGDDRNAPADDRQDHVLADKARVSLVIRMDRDGAVAEHRLRTRRCDRDEGRRILGIVGRPFDRIAKMPEMSVQFDLLDLKVGNGREELRVPVDQPLVLIDQPCSNRETKTSTTARDSPSSMVKRSRSQSQEAPSRFSWLKIVPPDSAFHSQTLR